MLAKNGDTLIDKGGNSYSVNALMISNSMFHEDAVNGDSKNKVNADNNQCYLVDTITLQSNE